MTEPTRTATRHFDPDALRMIEHACRDEGSLEGLRLSPGVSGPSA